MHKNETAADWKWQMTHRITTLAQLEKQVQLTAAERAAFADDFSFPFALTPYVLQLLNHPALRRAFLPSNLETTNNATELADPLGEEAHRATPHLIHTYPDKVLFLVTSFCPAYCRYCTRSRMVGKPQPTSDNFEETFQYIQAHPEIRDILLSGGDPLTLTDSQLDALLARLRTIPHIRTLRIGSKVPAVLPMRITPELCAILRKHRVWLSLHFIHPAELTAETQHACRILSDHGIGMVSQTVLLRQINDDLQTLTDLFYGLLEINVKPYYLLQCDPVHGTAHFRTTVEKGIQLIRALHGNISGLAVPQYVIDAPGGGGKIPLLSTTQIHRTPTEIILRNHQEKEYRYPAEKT